MTGTMTKTIQRQAAALLSATALFSAASANPVNMRADAEDTISFRLLKHNIDSEGNARLVVNASTMMDNKIAIMFDKVTKAAILMPGIDNKRACPFFDLDRYQHTINQIEAAKLDFEIKAKIDPEEGKKALEAQCLIVKIPSTRKINWKTDPNPPG